MTHDVGRATPSLAFCDTVACRRVTFAATHRVVATSSHRHIWPSPSFLLSTSSHTQLTPADLLLASSLLVSRSPAMAASGMGRIRARIGAARLHKRKSLLVVTVTRSTTQ